MFLSDRSDYAYVWKLRRTRNLVKFELGKWSVLSSSGYTWVNEVKETEGAYVFIPCVEEQMVTEKKMNKMNIDRPKICSY
jgi:hypothetical protein